MGNPISTKPADPPEQANRRRKRPPAADRFQVLVECRDEAEQRRLYEWLAANRYLCRVLVI